jgi:hypothetical protein
LVPLNPTILRLLSMQLKIHTLPALNNVSNKPQLVAYTLA